MQSERRLVVGQGPELAHAEEPTSPVVVGLFRRIEASPRMVGLRPGCEVDLGLMGIWLEMGNSTGTRLGFASRV